MTTTTYKNNGGFPPFIMLTMAAIILGLLYFGFMSGISQPAQTTILLQPEKLTADQIRVLELVSAHAYQTHGNEVNQAIRCLENKGSSKSFKTFFTDKHGNNIPTNIWLCFDGKDWYAVVTTTFQKIAGNQVARLVTAYRVAKDIFPTIEDFIHYISLKWNGREIQYMIEAGKILLDPK